MCSCTDKVPDKILANEELRMEYSIHDEGKEGSPHNETTSVEAFKKLRQGRSTIKSLIPIKLEVSQSEEEKNSSNLFTFYISKK